jgi:hypothetical protein
LAFSSSSAAFGATLACPNAMAVLMSKAMLKNFFKVTPSWILEFAARSKSGLVVRYGEGLSDHINP